MRKFVVVAVVLIMLVALFSAFFHFVARGSHRARFIIAMNELREAHAELQKYGAFTNRLRDDTVYPFTNRFEIEGTVYQCEFAAIESADLYVRHRGFLKITTNEVFVWVDKERGVMPLGSGSAFRFPPGL
jgi:hypothetical protein